MSFSSKHAPGTVYRRALRRVDRRSRAYIAAGKPAHLYALLVEACRLSNILAVYAYGSPTKAATSLLHVGIAR